MHVHSNQVYVSLCKVTCDIEQSCRPTQEHMGGQYCPGKVVRGTDYKGDKFACDTGHWYMIFGSPCISYLISTNRENASYSKKYGIRPTSIYPTNLTS